MISRSKAEELVTDSLRTKRYNTRPNYKPISLRWSLNDMLAQCNKRGYEVQLITAHQQFVASVKCNLIEHTGVGKEAGAALRMALRKFNKAMDEKVKADKKLDAEHWKREHPTPKKARKKKAVKKKTVKAAKNEASKDA